MIKTFRYFILSLVALTFISCVEKNRALVHTDYGEFIIDFHESTPLHKENFIKLVKEGYYDSLTFHRIEPGFVIQGGDPQSRTLPANDPKLGAARPAYKIDAEIGEHHIYGAVGMARDGNPQRASSDSQFYIVTGRVYPQQQLELIANSKEISYSAEEIEIYTTKGGAPSLDNEYTVFGQVVEGMETVEKIQQAKAQNPGLDKVYMKIKMVE